MINCQFTHRNVKHHIFADDKKNISKVIVSGEEVKPTEPNYKRAVKLFNNMMCYASKIK